MSVPIWSPYLKANKGSWLSDNSLLLFVQPRPCYLSRQCHLCGHCHLCNQYNAIYADNATNADNDIYAIYATPIVHTMSFIQLTQCQLCIQCHLICQTMPIMRTMTFMQSIQCHFWSWHRKVLGGRKRAHIWHCCTIGIVNGIVWL